MNLKYTGKQNIRILPVLAGLFLLGAVTGCDRRLDSIEPESSREHQTASFTFCGVGDNLLHDALFVYHEQDHGNRDYSHWYDDTAPYIQKADLAYINFETPCAGDKFGLRGYPSFNGPTEMIDVLARTGFDWFSTSSNHSLDAGAEGLLAEMNYINEHYPGIFYTGSYPNKAAQQEPTVMDVNGIRVGLASFTYGLNGYTLPDDKPWLVNVFLEDEESGKVNYDLMDRILDQLNESSDVQLVTMHWGTEYQNHPGEVQKEVARYLHEKGVEVVIGSHPHVIQPASFIKDQNQETLIYYSLGNFISGQDSAETMIGGMAEFTLEYDFTSRKASIISPSFTPTVTWVSPNQRQFSTHTIHEYTDDLATTQYVSVNNGEDISREYIKNYVSQVMGEPEGIEIILE